VIKPSVACDHSNQLIQSPFIKLCHDYEMMDCDRECRGTKQERCWWRGSGCTLSSTAKKALPMQSLQGISTSSLSKNERSRMSVSAVAFAAHAGSSVFSSDGLEWTLPLQAEEVAAAAEDVEKLQGALYGRPA